MHKATDARRVSRNVSEYNTGAGPDCTHFMQREGRATPLRQDTVIHKALEQDNNIRDGYNTSRGRIRTPAPATQAETPRRREHPHEPPRQPTIYGTLPPTSNHPRRVGYPRSASHKPPRRGDEHHHNNVVSGTPAVRQVPRQSTPHHRGGDVAGTPART